MKKEQTIADGMTAVEGSMDAPVRSDFISGETVSGILKTLSQWNGKRPTYVQIDGIRVLLDHVYDMSYCGGRGEECIIFVGKTQSGLLGPLPRSSRESQIQIQPDLVQPEKSSPDNMVVSDQTFFQSENEKA